MLVGYVFRGLGKEKNRVEYLQRMFAEDRGFWHMGKSLTQKPGFE